MSFLIMLLQILQLLLTILSWVFVINIIMSWLIGFNVISTYNEYVRTLWLTLERFCRPFYDPVRRILPDFGPLDLAPMAVLLIISILNNYVLNWLIGQLANAGY